MVFLALVTGHFMADFMLQSGFKEERKGIHLAGHLVVMTGALACCLWMLETWTGAGLTVMTVATGSVVLAVVHVCQDYIVARLQKLPRKRISDLVLLVSDQGLHVLVLAGVAFIIAQPTIAMPAVVASGHEVSTPQVVLGSILLLTLGTGVSAVLLAHLLSPFKELVDAEDDGVNLPTAGLWIGLCERFLLILVIASGSEVFSSVGLVMGAKSVYRFRELDKRASAEYYLLGSLISICIAVVIGLSLRWLRTATPPGTLV